MIPNQDSYCEIDPSKTDAWGIPVLRFHWKWSEHEINQVKHMEKTFASIIETMGGTPMGRAPAPDRAISTGGTIIHEAGTVRMGKDPKTSVLNSYCQSHEVKNLFVCDAAPFVSNPDKNVTLSIVAFSWRASEYLAEEMRKGNV
jgi:choline dehydrogenase-like flavoprotein